MTQDNLQELVDSTDDLVNHFRNLEYEMTVWEYPGDEYTFHKEYTHWIEEQRAWRESVALMDQSYHMANMVVEANSDNELDAIDLFSRVGVNNFDSFINEAPPQAKQFVAVNPNGYMIGDCIVFYLKENHFLFVGEDPVMNWLKFHADRNDYDLNVEYTYQPEHAGIPEYYRFQLAGPNTWDIVEQISDNTIDISFFEMQDVSIDGTNAYALGHQMTGERGIEIFGPYSKHDDVKEEILSIGENFGIRETGMLSYATTVLEVSWIPLPLPAIYDNPELREYREWLSADTLEGNFSLGGSFNPDHISDYYITPNAMGYNDIIDLDHEFIGRDALKDRENNSEWENVVFVLDDDSMVDLYASLFRDGDTYRYLAPPLFYYQSSLGKYDRIERDGEIIGIAKTPIYNYNEREVAALGYIKPEYAVEGTTVSYIWGDPEINRPQVERHLVTDIEATVGSTPYVEKGRRSM